MRAATATRLARWYPRAWRARYEEEFVAMLEQQPPSFGVAIDILAGAADAHARRILAAGGAFLALRLVPWLWWTLACAAGWVGLMAIMYVALLRYAVAASQAGPAELAARLALGGLAAGAALGAAQWLVVRQVLPAPGRWVWATALGWTMGAAVALVLQVPIAMLHLTFGWPGDQILRGGAFGLVTGAVVAAAQGRLLRRAPPAAGWWILVSAAGWGLGWLVGGLQSSEMLGGSDVGPGFHPAGVFAGVIVAPALGGALAGLVTGPVLAALLRLEAPVRPFVHRPRASLPTVAAALALLAVVAGPAVAHGRDPIWRVQTVTAWPAALVVPAVTPRPTTTSRTAGAFSGATMFTVTTLAEARPHLPFRVLTPGALPSGYELGKVQGPSGLLRSPRLPPRMGWIELLYADPAHQRTGSDWRVSPGALPDRALAIVESSADRGQPVDISTPPGAAHPLSIGGAPAVYLDATAGGQPGSAAVIPNPAVNQLVLARAGTLVTISGWRGGGVDRAALERVAASLR